MASRPVKLKLLPRSTMKAKCITAFPVRIIGGDGILASKTNGIWTVSVDVDNLQAVAGLVIGTDVQAQDADLQALADNTGTGLWSVTGAGTGHVRTLTAPAAGITVTNGDGVAGNPMLVLANDLAALEGLASTGIAARIAADSWTQLTLAGTASRITVTNGDGVAGNPTFDISASYVGQATITTLGTITTGVWNGTDIAFANIAQGSALSVLGVAGNAGADLASIVAASDNQVFRRSGTSVGFGAINLASSNAVSGVLPVANYATGTPNGLKFVRDDGVLATPAGAGDLLSTNNLSDVANAQTSRGNLQILQPPQGRLTIQTLTPVMTATQSGKTVAYYTPYVGNQIPIYDGTKMVPTTFVELAVNTTDTAKSPAAIGASKVNDWFVWNDAGTIRLGHGPDWTSDTARSAGTALVMVNGILLNNASITNGPAASRGTYVGTTRSNGSSQLDWIFPVTGAGPTAGFFGVWNMYNRNLVSSTFGDSTGSWNYTTATWRQARANTTFQVQYVVGLSEDAIQAVNTIVAGNTSNAGQGIGIGVDSNTTPSGIVGGQGNSVFGQITAFYAGLPGIGLHTISAIEFSQAAGTTTWYGSGIPGVTSGQTGMTFAARM